MMSRPTVSDISDSDMEQSEDCRGGVRVKTGVGKENKQQGDRGVKRIRQEGSSGPEANEGRENKKGEDTERYNVVVRFVEEGGVMKINPVKLSKMLQELIGNILFAKVLNDGNLLIGCADENQLNKVKKIKNIGSCKVGNIVKVGEQKTKRGCRGVITGVPLSVKLEELKSNLDGRGKAIISVKRMTRGSDRVECETVLVEFEGEVLPDRAYLGFMCYFVRAYIPRPLRCFKCQKFGHIANGCKERRRCARCGGDHGYGECGVGVQPKCCSCGGAHSVAYGGCEVMKHEVEVQQVKVKNKITYAEAVKEVKQKRGIEKAVGGGEVSGAGGIEQPGEGRMWLDKKKLVTFISGVLNTIGDIKSKTERIRLIVGAAVKYLGMSGVKWEEVNDVLQSGGDVRVSQEEG